MEKQLPQNGTARRVLRGLTAATLILGTVAVTGTGCLSRPVSKQEPTTKVNFTAKVKQSAIDKIDLLFAIDNSASMGDKQVILSEAVPDLLKRLLTPNCVDEAGAVQGVSTGEGVCPAGQKVEFPPVHDMHIGIVSSALGGRGSDSCPPVDPNDAKARNDDKGHLINRGGDAETPVEEAKPPSNFLSWLPPVDKNKEKIAAGATGLADAKVLEDSFKEMVGGVHEHGCGYEAQLESAYRFLVQPDPYAEIRLEETPDGKVARYNGVDGELLKQRAAFLRPDSLVAIVMVTDENESTVDPLAFGGRAYFYEGLGNVKAGTSICDSRPTNPGCQSCYLAASGSDPKCQVPLNNDTDHPNVRFFHPKRRFGYDPRFPADRYVKGFSQKTVPDRNGEHPKDAAGNPSFNYVGRANCTNPLFATKLPTDPTANLCQLQPGPRDTDLVFFALIGGVPWQLLTEEPENFTNENKAPFKATLSNNDWLKLIGKDPEKYDFSGIDPHMMESITPRAGLGADDAHLREWDTKNQDLQYACTFPFPDAPTAPKGRKNCEDPRFAGACDCTKPGANETATDSPLCDPAARTVQTYGKAYPTIQELRVAKAMDEQGIVASICPREVTDKDSQDYGYRPAVRAIVDRLKNALANQCLPQPLTANPEGRVPCLILVTLREAGDQATSCSAADGLKQPAPAVLAKFRESQREEAGGADAGASLEQFPVCEVVQLTKAQLDKNGSCVEPGVEAGWCYVTGKSAGGCPQAIKFSERGNPKGIVSLQCINNNEAAPATGGTTTGDGG